MSTKKPESINDDDEFQTLIEQGGHTALVLFYATWSKPCKDALEQIEQVTQLLDDVVPVYIAELESVPLAAAKHGVESIPLFALFMEAKAVSKMVGARRVEDIHQMVLQKLEI